MGEFLEVLETARVGQGIQVDNPDVLFDAKKITHKIRSNETGAAGNQYILHYAVS
jgi:hypothetical protein